MQKIQEEESVSSLLARLAFFPTVFAIGALTGFLMAGGEKVHVRQVVPCPVPVFGNNEPSQEEVDRAVQRCVAAIRAKDGSR